MHRFTRILRHKLEFLVLDLKESMIVESGDESFHKLGPDLSPYVWYIPTVILYFKLKRRLPPRTSVDGLLQFRLPRNHYCGSAAGKMSPVVMSDSLTEHQISEVLSPRVWTQPIFVRSTENAFVRVLTNLAGIKFVSTHQSLSRFRITC
jgi:hypothetical protein